MSTLSLSIKHSIEGLAVEIRQLKEIKRRSRSRDSIGNGRSKIWLLVDDLIVYISDP